MSGSVRATATRRQMPLWLLVAISALAGLFYAFAVWNSVANLTQAITFYGDAGLSINALGWFVWIFAAVFPIVVWAAAFTLGYRRRVHELLLIMVTGLALVAVFWLNVVAYTGLYTTSFVG